MDYHCCYCSNDSSDANWWCHISVRCISSNLSARMISVIWCSLGSNNKHFKMPWRPSRYVKWWRDKNSSESTWKHKNQGKVMTKNVCYAKRDLVKGINFMKIPVTLFARWRNFSNRFITIFFIFWFVRSSSILFLLLGGTRLRDSNNKRRGTWWIEAWWIFEKNWTPLGNWTVF